MSDRQPGVNPKHARFVDEYLVDNNATQAAIRAGYSAKTARQIGARLLTNVDISAAIDAGRAAIAERNALTQDEVIAGLRKEATREGDGSSHGARVSAWIGLGKHLGMFTDVVRTEEDYRKEFDEARSGPRLVA
jgi:phage terminase small subunit